MIIRKLEALFTLNTNTAQFKKAASELDNLAGKAEQVIKAIAGYWAVQALQNPVTNTANRGVLSKYGNVPVLLKAGYRDHVGVIFQGDMVSCTHEKEGLTWKTVLANGDGAKSIQSARIKKSFAKGTPVQDIIKEIAKQLKLPCDGAFKKLEGIGEKLARGFCVKGNAMDELSRILALHGLGVSVQNNSLQLLKQGEAYTWHEETYTILSIQRLWHSPKCEAFWG